MDDLYKVEAIGNVKPVLLMILLQTLYAVVNMMLKIVADDGMSLSILVAYRFIFATAFIVPLALIVERKHLQYVTGQVVFLGFLCGLFGGSLLQGLYVKSLALTSAVYVTAMLNLIPGVTYLMSVSLGLEKSNLRTAGGMAKLVGTLTGIGGAMVLTFYKGRKLCLWSSHIGLLHHAQSPHGAPTGSPLWGCILAFGAALTYSVWLIIQGILASGVCYTLLAWCVRRKGPLFASAFSPLMLVIVTLIEPLVTDKCPNLGSVTGSVLVVGGLYLLLWGKIKETQMKQSKETQMKQIEVFSEDSVQCETIHFTNPSLACCQRDQDKKIVTSVTSCSPSTISTIPK
ncbi:WAT1-related protein [Vigna unguiculata]|uniref:WAT1-related protein n=1 Tax=Vigna unguiculata TaxID=3917 RepID=A0A4D6L677_VIGUN|nr:WAT1-related protein [Vigna unguiculata]